MKLLASLALIIAACASPVLAQEHEHGVGGLPDWYDPVCCNTRDRPVEDAELEFDMIGDAPVIRHKPTGATFYRNQWKTSQDERYHVCIMQGSVALCVYIRAGA